MELSKETVRGLISIQNVNAFPEDTFLQILDNVMFCVCKNITEVKSISKVYGPKPEMAKIALADLTCLFVEASRCDLDKNSFDEFLHHERINGPRAEKLRDFYLTNKSMIQAELESIGNNLPHVIDVDWRLDYCVKSSTQYSFGIPLYHIRLQSKKPEGSKNITFTCTIQQLQELVYKLKETARQVEKIASM